MMQTWIRQLGLGPEEIDGEACLKQLLEEMALGLEGKGNIPMIPAYLPLEIPPVPGEKCCVLDAGGTNLRSARAVCDPERGWILEDAVKVPMPGTRGELTFDEFYGELASHVRRTGCPGRVGFCFSYNVSIGRDLDGILDAWCKEVRVPEAPGKPVGASLRRAVGEGCGPVRVLNDSTAALLGARSGDPRITVGLILGTGINVCYEEACKNIPKLPAGLKGDAMIVSTEIGEFRGIPKTVFEEAVIAASDDPALAQGEKQCAGAYLGDIISLAWQEAARQGLLPPEFEKKTTLPQISEYLAGAPEGPAALLARTMIRRAVKIAAILTAGAILRSTPEGGECVMVIEGSQYSRLTGFAEAFREALDALLKPRNIRADILEGRNSCLLGAALAAFAQPM